MTTATMALAELAEKGADVDVLRQVPVSCLHAQRFALQVKATKSLVPIRERQACFVPRLSTFVAVRWRGEPRTPNLRSPSPQGGGADRPVGRTHSGGLP